MHKNILLIGYRNRNGKLGLCRFRVRWSAKVRRVMIGRMRRLKGLRGFTRRSRDKKY
jgi:hypothetical protein